MVGTATALFSGLDDLTGCKDKAGAATGLPDIGAVVLGHTRGVRGRSRSP